MFKIGMCFSLCGIPGRTSFGERDLETTKVSQQKTFNSILIVVHVAYK